MGCSPFHPDGNLVEGQEEAASQKEDQEEKAAPSDTNVLISTQSSYHAEQCQAHAVNDKEEQQVCEEPAMGTTFSSVPSLRMVQVVLESSGDCEADYTHVSSDSRQALLLVGSQYFR